MACDKSSPATLLISLCNSHTHHEYGYTYTFSCSAGSGRVKLGDQAVRSAIHDSERVSESKLRSENTASDTTSRDYMHTAINSNSICVH